MQSSIPSFLQRPVLSGKINFPVCLAPMVGLSHIVLRRIMREYLPKGAKTLWPTEMLNSRRIPGENLLRLPEAFRGQNEHELNPQILANEPEPIRKSIEKLTDWGAEAIDVNMGCPVKKALSHNYGVALMGDPAYAAEVVRMAVRCTSLPISVKLRAAPSGAGDQINFDYLEHFVLGLQEAGASWIALHPRTADQMRRGRADWSQIGQIRSTLRIPVIGNGDVQTAQDAVDLLNVSQCDMVMIGRAATARPWILWQLGDKFGFPPPAGKEGLAPPVTPEEEGNEYLCMLKRTAQFMEEEFVAKGVTEELALRKFRFFVRTGSGWLDFGLKLHAISCEAKSFSALHDKLAQFAPGSLRMSGRTDLRQ